MERNQFLLMVTTRENILEKQIQFGPRIPGSQGSHAAKIFIKTELESSGWRVEFQEFWYDSKKLSNIIAKSSTNEPEIIIGTHYDTREFSDNESSIDLQKTPVPGANDGGSGTAVLLELGSYLIEKIKIDIWLVFFDAEDQGKINDWEWSVGAQYFGIT